MIMKRMHLKEYNSSRETIVIAITILNIIILSLIADLDVLNLLISCVLIFPCIRILRKNSASKTKTKWTFLLILLINIFVIFSVIHLRITIR